MKSLKRIQSNEDIVRQFSQKLHEFKGSKFDNLYAFMPNHLYKSDLQKIGQSLGNIFKKGDIEAFLKEKGEFDVKKRRFVRKEVIKETQKIPNSVIKEVVKYLKTNYSSLDEAWEAIQHDPVRVLRQKLCRVPIAKELPQNLTESVFKSLFGKGFRRTKKRTIIFQKVAKWPDRCLIQKLQNHWQTYQEVLYRIGKIGWETISFSDLEDLWIKCEIPYTQRELQDHWRELDLEGVDEVNVDDIKRYWRDEFQEIRQWKSWFSDVELGYLHWKAHMRSMKQDSAQLFSNIRIELGKDVQKLFNALLVIPDVISFVSFRDLLSKFYDVKRIDTNQIRSLLYAFRTKWNYENNVEIRKIVPYFKPMDPADVAFWESRLKEINSDAKHYLCKLKPWPTVDHFTEIVKFQRPDMNIEALSIVIQDHVVNGLVNCLNLFFSRSKPKVRQRIATKKLLRPDTATTNTKRPTTASQVSARTYTTQRTAFRTFSSVNLRDKLKLNWPDLQKSLKMLDVGQTGFVEFENFVATQLRLKICLTTQEISALSDNFVIKDLFNYVSLGNWIEKRHKHTKTSSIERGIVGLGLSPRNGDRTERTSERFVKAYSQRSVLNRFRFNV